MAGVIKAGQLDKRREREQSPTAFTLEDIEKRRDAMLQQVRSQAAEILQQAKRDGEAIRAQAAIDGQQQAQVAAEQAVRAELAAQAATLMPAVEAAIHELQLAKEQWKAHWNAAILELAAAIAAKIVRRELEKHPVISSDLIAESVELAAGAQQIQIYLNPADVESLTPIAEQLAAQFRPLGPALIQPDGSVEPGFCRIRTEFGEIDQTLATQLSRIVEELK